MQISLEKTEKYAIQAYSESEIKINNNLYELSLIISQESLISPWPIQSVRQLDEVLLEPLIKLNPEVIIIGHGETGVFPPQKVFVWLSNQRIGFECMSLGAACRTYNVMLSEQRTVVAGLILS